MSNEETHIKKRRKWPWILLAVLVVLIGGLRFAMQSDAVLNILREQVQKIASEQLNGKLEIASFTGDLFGEITLRGVRLIDDQGFEVARIDSLSASYGIWSLISGPFQINDISVYQPHVNAIQIAEDQWNLLKIVPESEEETDTFPLDIHQIRVFNGSARVESTYLLPDNVISVDSLQVNAGISLREEGIRSRLSQLDFLLIEGRLPEPIRFDIAAETDEKNYTLNKLVVSTGRTMLEMYAHYEDDGADVDLDLELKPLSWRDVLAYTEDAYFIQDVTLELGVSGSLAALQTTLSVQSTGLENLYLELDGNFEADPRITRIGISSGYIDLPMITGDAGLPYIGAVDVQFNGFFSPADVNNASLSGDIRISDVRSSSYRLSELAATLNLNQERLTSDIRLTLDNEQIDINADVNRVFDENLAWAVTMNGERVDVGKWAAIEDLDLITTIMLEAKGVGYEPGATPWDIDFLATDTRYDEQLVNKLEINADVSANEIELLSVLRFESSSVELNGAVFNWQTDEIAYSFYLETTELDLRDIVGLEEFPTCINLRALGEGRGIDPETMQVTSSLEIDSSIINGADIERFQANLYLQNAVLELRNTFLESTLATGKLDVRQNIVDVFSPQNRVDFNLEIGNLNPLAPLAGLDFLDVSGTASGSYSTAPSGKPQIETTLSLRDITVDSIYVARVEGRSTVQLGDEIDYEMDLRISDLLVAEFGLDNLWITTEGTQRDSSVVGNYRINVDFSENTRINTQAQYNVLLGENDLRVALETDVLQLRDSNYIYNLRNSFMLYLEDELVRIEPIILIGSEGVELQLEVEQYMVEAFRGRFEASEVNLAILQRIVMDEALFDGMMNGGIHFDVDLSTSFYDIESNLVITELDYDGFLVDSFDVNLLLRDNRLKGGFLAMRDNMMLAEAELDLPFQLGDPTEFDESFFEEFVSARLATQEFDLAEETALSALIGLAGVTGRLNLSASLEGTAGNPDFTTSFELIQARISGVSIDSLLFAAEYHHDDARFETGTRVVSANQLAARVDGSLPFSIDMRTFEVDLPDDEQGIDMRIRTNDFNLAAFNQFADRDFVRNIAGRLNADLNINGTYEQPEITGSLKLERAAVSLVENNVTIREIETDLSFNNDVIRLNNLSMQSLGSLSGSGEISLDGFTPQNVDINLRARNFRVYNTRDIQVIFSMNTELTGGFETPKLTGNVQLERGYLFLDNFGERTVEDVVLEGEDESTFDGYAFWEALEMELNFSTDRNFWVRNRSRPEVNLQLTGELDLVKFPNNDIEVFGSMGASDGFISQLGRRFDIEEAAVVFSGPPENPDLAIRSVYELRQPTDVKIWYIIGGNVEEPKFTYESEPQMELQDIVSYTLFGRPFHALMGWQQSVSGSSEGGVADAAVDILLDRVEQFAAQALGVDVLTIDNTRTGGQSGTTIKAGKYVSDRMFVALIQELGATVRSQVMLEYELRRNLNIIVTGSDDNRSGVDVQWKRDY